MKKTICLLLSVILFLLCAAVPAAAEAAEYEVTFSLAGCEPLNRDMLAYPGNKVREGVRVFIGTKNADLPAGKYIRSFSSDPAGVGFLPMEDCFTFEMPSNDVTISAELGNRTAAEIDLSGEAAVSINWFLYRALLTFYDSTLTGTGAGYFFIDVNNDGNDDLMLYGEDGKVTAERMKTGADLIKNPVEISLTKANAGENVYAQVPYTAVKLIFTKQPAQEPEPAVYTVTVTDDGNGTGAADPKSGVTGTVVKLTAAPKEGYVFREWQVLSGSVTVSGDQFTIGTANVGIKACFAPETTDISGAEVTVSEKEYVYTGKECKPAVTVRVTDAAGQKQELAPEHYDVSYEDNVIPGTAKAVVTGKGSYCGTAKGTFRIRVSKVIELKLQSGEKRIKVTASKESKDAKISGYVISYRRTDLKRWQKKTVKTKKKLSKVLTKLNSSRAYRVKVCAFVKIGSTKYCGKFCAVKSIIVK